MQVLFFMWKGLCIGKCIGMEWSEVLKEPAGRDSFATVKVEKALVVVNTAGCACSQLKMTHTRRYPMAGLVLNTFMLK